MRSRGGSSSPSQLRGLRKVNGLIPKVSSLSCPLLIPSGEKEKRNTRCQLCYGFRAYAVASFTIIQMQLCYLEAPEDFLSGHDELVSIGNRPDPKRPSFRTLSPCPKLQRKKERHIAINGDGQKKYTYGWFSFPIESHQESPFFLSGKRINRSGKRITSKKRNKRGESL